MIEIDLSTLTDTGKNRLKSLNHHFDPKNGAFYYGFPKLKMTNFFQEFIYNYLFGF